MPVGGKSQKNKSSNGRSPTGSIYDNKYIYLCKNIINKNQSL